MGHARAMAGNLDMGHHTITGIKSSSADNAALTVGGAKATYLPLSGDRAMQATLDMANHKIINAAVPTEDEDGANKKYVDDEIAKLPHSDTGTLKLDGSRTMTGNLNMGHHTISGIKSSSADNAALTVGGAKATYLPLSGNRAMQDTLNLGGNSIINIKEPDISDSN